MDKDNFLKYKNYLGSIEYNLKDKVLFGKLLFIDDLISYEGETINELENNFKDAVEDYLQTCAELGKKPQKSYSGSFNIRTTPLIHHRLSYFAKVRGVSLNKLVTEIFNSYIENNQVNI
ncbi:Predicted nuclease of the RNAse H fold, HicB family [Succinivibrio dextrinosolvens]|uniref:type II toxin-antitoxin system HicB family antitoxin n=1 Tax=Succinivibrio dextrinosolvens TaxID=83771 RepID=UPI0008EEC133|nr:type II toxin-antitoxin system HicB family antitoxin [Succinivibrio dextrinosolvens]SFS92225.1 Predicted nuclease of the RNAse H fold, HicB family [Succinivibrio dextrinosolvens]